MRGRADVGALFERDRDIAGRYARALVWDPDRVDDLVAEAFARVTAAAADGRLDGRDARPYLLATVRSVCVDALRRRSVEQAAPALAPVGVSSVEELALERADIGRVRAAYWALSERHQTVLWLRDVEGLSPEAVADTLGLSVNALYQLHHRGRTALRERYVELAAELRTAHCAWVARELARRDSLSDEARAHLDECEECQERRDDLAWFGARFPAALAGIAGLSSALAERRGRTQRSTPRAQAATVAAAISGVVALMAAAVAFVGGNDGDGERAGAGAAAGVVGPPVVEIEVVADEPDEATVEAPSPDVEEAGAPLSVPAEAAPQPAGGRPRAEQPRDEAPRPPAGEAPEEPPGLIDPVTETRPPPPLVSIMVDVAGTPVPVEVPQVPPVPPALDAEVRIGGDEIVGFDVDLLPG